MAMLEQDNVESSGQFFENKIYEEISVGDTAEITITVGPHDIAYSSKASEEEDDPNFFAEYEPIALPKVFTSPELWRSNLISKVLDAYLPGPGPVFLSQSLQLEAPINLGDSVTVLVAVSEKRENDRLVLTCICLNQHGHLVIKGVAEVIAPLEKVRRPSAILPVLQKSQIRQVVIQFPEQGSKYGKLILAASEQAAVHTAVVYPCDSLSITAVRAAASQRIIVPVLVGPKAKIIAAAKIAGQSLNGMEIVDVPDSHGAAAAAVALARGGKVSAIMKGSLPSHELMDHILDSSMGLRTKRRMSHVFVLDVPTYAKPLLVTDAALNIFPTLVTKRDIVQNAIDLAHALDISRPKIAILPASKAANPKIVSTFEAAWLCRMADRGEISGGLVDGPLALDSAISHAAAAAKGIVSDVAGDADIVVAPDLETADMAVKQLIYLAGGQAAGIVLGARVPIILPNQTDGLLSRLASCAFAQRIIRNGANARP